MTRWMLILLTATMVPATAGAQNIPFYGTRGTFFADVTGDGRADAIALDDGSTTIRRSNGRAFADKEINWMGGFYGSISTAFADVNGDGAADAIAVNPTAVTVRLSTRSAFLPNKDWAGPYFGDLGTYFADVNGDNMADAIVVNYSNVTVRLSDGTQFLPNKDFTTNPYYGQLGTYFADVNGDGMADAIIVNYSNVTVRLSDGTQFLPNTDFTTNPYYGQLGTYFADVNGDGMADAIVVNYSNVTVRFSDGSQFLPNRDLTTNDYYGDLGTSFADVDGDGTADGIVVNYGGVTVRRSNAIPLLPNEDWSPGIPSNGPLVIVSAGDSYASGEGAPDQSGPFAVHPIWRGNNDDGLASLCHRSQLAGAADAARQLGASRDVAFAAFACTGSVTGATPQGGGLAIGGNKSILGTSRPGQLGGQLENIKKSARGPIDALILSIGGNDIGFSDIVKTCMLPFYRCDLDTIVLGSLANNLNDLPRRLDEITAAVNSGAAGTVSHVFIQEYPDPTTGPYLLRCGSWWTPAFQGFEGIEEAEALWASTSVVAPLNALLADAVNRANAAPQPRAEWHFVTGIASRFATHGYCTGGGGPILWVTNPRFINTPLDSTTGQGDVDGSMHPNDLGQRAIAAALFDSMRLVLK